MTVKTNSKLIKITDELFVFDENDKMLIKC